nr:thyroxine (T4)-binding protein, TBP {Lys-C internal fragment} [turtles, blood, Peptide Partial, 15 aa] [Testudines]
IMSASFEDISPLAEE